MTIIYGVSHVLIDERTSATVATSTTVVEQFTSTTGARVGVSIALTTHTSAKSVMSTMLMAVMVIAKKVGIPTAIVLSMTIVIDLMQSSTQLIRMSDYTLV
jgi:uncharacterized membrane protein